MAEPQTVVTSLADRMATGPLFETLFRAGMALVEETAAYLDGQGRIDARQLRGAVKFAYSTETMKLTQALMKYARWLLLHRTIKDGERTLEECGSPAARVDVPQPYHVARFDELPEELRNLLTRAEALGKEMRRFDAIFHPRR